MAELRYDYNSIRREIARELGFDTTPANWTTKENQDVEDVLDFGLRLYYNPPLIAGERTHHRWSFLQPVGTIDLTPGVEDYDLPGNFQGITGGVVLETQTGCYTTLRQVGEGDIRSLRARFPTASGHPTVIAVTSYRDELDEPTKWRAHFYPTPNIAAPVTFRYLAGQERLDANNLYVLGPSSLDDFLRAAVMAACELRMDDEKGKHWETYIERAREAIMDDRRNRQDTFPGQNVEHCEGGARGCFGPAFFFAVGYGDYGLIPYPVTDQVIPPSAIYCDEFGVPYIDDEETVYCSDPG